MNQQRQVSLGEVIGGMVRTLYKIQDEIEGLANRNNALEAEVKNLKNNQEVQKPATEVAETVN